MGCFRIGLLPRILLAIVSGIALGLVLSEPLIRLFVTFNGLFSQLLGTSMVDIMSALIFSFMYVALDTNIPSYHLSPTTGGSSARLRRAAVE